jgi:CheY-like chemotaxis protein
VLVVEDDADDRALLNEILLSAGYVVETARTGAEAASKSRQRYYDVVVLDLILPDSSGFDVLRTIREEGKNPTARVIVVTMVKETGLRTAYSVSEWLVKPVEAGQLLAALERVGVRPDCGTVLVVDDDPASRKLAEVTLKQLGCRVVCADGGEEGLEAAAHGRLDAIVLDLMMPGVDGFRVLERLRFTAGGAQVPVIVWTGKDMTAAEQETLRQTAHALVGKSQRDASLLDEIKPLLPGVGARQ